MRDVCAFIPVVNRPDLLQDAILNATELWGDLTVIDNSEKGMVVNPDHINVYRGPVPLTFSQSMNLEFEMTMGYGKKFMLHMHSDSVVPPRAIEKLIATARQVESEGRKWGVIYTHYDVMAIYNPKAYLDIGGYDVNLPSYFSDNDWYHRLDLAGWERINTSIEVGHIGSQTINSDPYLQMVNGVTFPLYRQYYIAKWGGEPDAELYYLPFNFTGERL